MGTELLFPSVRRTWIAAPRTGPKWIGNWHWRNPMRKDLMGARDLYIAEIYDVAKTGDTQKPFGRVFYTKDKSLVFYGYDLDQQPGIKNAGTFQAWGRRGADHQHEVSLGILYQDDSSKKRWVLKVNDAATLAQ